MSVAPSKTHSKKRGNKDRRSGKERRSGKGPKSQDWNGQERRAGKERRSGLDRRQIERERRKYTVESMVLGVALIGALFYFYASQPPTQAKVVKQTNSMFSDSGEKKYTRPQTPQTPQTQTRAESKPKPKPKPTVQAFSNDILNIAPNIYASVRIVLEEGQSVDQHAMGHLDLRKVKTRWVEIDVNAPSWDGVESQERIDLLYNTFSLLKSRYPFITPYVRLIFDDQRPKQDYKFDDFQEKKSEIS